jgi:hypothetical protein
MRIERPMIIIILVLVSTVASLKEVALDFPMEASGAAPSIISAIQTPVSRSSGTTPRRNLPERNNIFVVLRKGKQALNIGADRMVDHPHSRPTCS